MFLSRQTECVVITDDISDDTRTLLRHHQFVEAGISVIEYGTYVALLAVLIAEVGLAASTWLSVQTVAGLLGGFVLVGVGSVIFERTALGRSADGTFRRHRLVVSLLVVALVAVGGIAVSAALEAVSRLFSLALALGLLGGSFVLEGVADYRQ
jgi:hypothetical protein